MRSTPIPNRRTSGLLSSLFALMVLLTGAAVSPIASAQVAAPTWNPSDLKTLNNMLSSMEGIKTVSVTGGAGVQAASNVTVAANGLRIPVPVTSQATITGARLAAAGLKLARAASLVGAAYTGYELYKWWQEQGLTTCAAPDFFCKPGSLTGTVSGVDGKTYTNFTVQGLPAAGTHPTAQAACNAYVSFVNAGAPRTVVESLSGNGLFFCPGSPGDQGVRLNGVLATGTAAPLTITDAEFQNLAQQRIDAAPDAGKKLLDALLDDNLYQTKLVPGDLLPDTTPVTISAPPTSSPQTTTKTETITNPDGTTSTRTTTGTTTVTTSQDGTTVKDAQPKFTVQTVENVSTTNNTTNVTTNNTTTTTAPPAQPAEGPKECGSPGRPPCNINETGTPSAESATGYFTGPQAALDATEQAAKDLQTSATSSSGKQTGWTFSFSLPSGCSAIPIYEGVVVDLCEWQPMIHDLMSLAWIGACIFGCITMVGATMRQSNG